MLKELAIQLCNIFGTDQIYHAEQQDDGTYRKKSGLVTPALLAKGLESGSSIAIYQKNTDASIKWICFDFDILKSNLEVGKIERATLELNNRTTIFCRSLDKLEIPYLLETSGNRGFHIWISLSEATRYQVGHEILLSIIEKLGFEFDKEQIAVDLFPASRMQTDGVGLGVKIPLSKHKKTGQYSHLLCSIQEIETWAIHTHLDDELIKKNLEILRQHKGTTKDELERKLGVVFSAPLEEEEFHLRTKSIKIPNPGFSIEELKAHWALHPPLAVLADRIFIQKTLNHKERKLLVGILGNLECRSNKNFGQAILLEIFQQTENYNAGLTQRAIKTLASFYFPSQEQIEGAVGEKFSLALIPSELIRACIPQYLDHKDATFDISRSDVEITKTAELNYLLLNDEAQSKFVLNELSMLDSEELLMYVIGLLEAPATAKFYRHSRNEGKKTRTLYTLEAAERVLTSCILKQLVHFYQFTPSENSYGYRVNKGFSKGYIFEPWLYLWIKFISNISSAIEDKNNADCYIVKIDVGNFYDKIPHDNLKRMLLGGVNSKIDSKRSLLTKEAEKQYKNLVDAIFAVTAKLVDSNVGLPQGPAYARFLAEIYLDNIDSGFDEKIRVGELHLYQRYVDDIFFIAPTKDAAHSTLENITRELESLGLQLNSEKTIFSQVKNFGDKFNKYRSQSKYAIDRIPKNFGNATETQQNVAVREFVKLVDSDNFEDDLSFIFSHLNGVHEVEKYKREKVVPCLKKGLGRGSVYKHLFAFVLENPDNYELLLEVEKFTELQSEVLTSAFLTALETNKSKTQELNALLEKIEGRLSATDMVLEHLCYLALIFSSNVNLMHFPPDVIIKVLASIPSPEKIQLKPPVISYLNTSLNNIKSLSLFIRAMHPLCTSDSVDAAGLNSLASTFYAKLTVDQANGSLSTEIEPEINTAATGLKFYYLLCLFSISRKNSSRELLKAMWKYCAHVHNIHDIDSTKNTATNWLKKINNIESDDAKCQFIISSIVDGNIFRGLADNSRIFERFHTLLLIFVSFKGSAFVDIEIDAVLETLKDRAIFYKWLIDRRNVQLFPSSRIWFERNVIENSTIVLKRENEVLFRKPTDGFHASSNPVNEHVGYSEVLAPYDPVNLKSLAEILEKLSVKEKFGKLFLLIRHCDSSPKFPNLYCQEKILSEVDLRPFSLEFFEAKNLIFEDPTGGADSYANNRDNFIACFLRLASNVRNGQQIADINEKYIQKLGSDIDLFAFVESFYNQIIEMGDEETAFFFDLAAGAALYSSLSHIDPIRRIEKFTDMYHKFNSDKRDRHLYGVSSEICPTDSSPIELLSTIEKSLGAITNAVLPSLTFYLDRDISSYRLILSKIINSDILDMEYLTLEDFKKVSVRTSVIRESISLDNKTFKFSEVKIVNPVYVEVVQLETKHAVLIDSSEHVYALVRNGKACVIAIQNSISNIYDSIVDRTQYQTQNGRIVDSFPGPVFSPTSICVLDGFSHAVDVIVAHRDLPRDDAELRLVNWLKFLPPRYHQPLITLIGAHHVMSNAEINCFIEMARKLIADRNSNPFLIKDIGDYNGTHRVLYRDNGIGRSVFELSPLNIRDDAETATILVDNIISGTQVISAITYYVTGEGYKETARYYQFSKGDGELVKSRLKKLKRLDICTILYTSKGFNKIKTAFRTIFGEHIDVRITSGRDIGDDALFGSTQRIGEARKDEIREMLGDRNEMKNLFSHLTTNDPQRYINSLTLEEINRSNLVARYQSLPKKCFMFLHCGLRHEPGCHPMVRVLEANE